MAPGLKHIPSTILITGGTGFVGSRVVSALQGKFNLLTPGHNELDVTSAEDVDSYVSKKRPDAILHLAAISNTGYCEEHPEESFLVNVTSVENLANAASRYGAKLVFFSSDQVYNGNLEEGLLSEDLPLKPENHYGRHKLLAEQRALAICKDTVALRATWMYDVERPGMKTHGNFVLNFQKALAERIPLRFATREYRGITWIEEVVKNIPYTFELPGGVYNFGAENDLNTYEIACRYAELLITCRGDVCKPNHLSELSKLVVADPSRFPEHVRNISISMKRTFEASDGKIQFKNTLDGLVEFLNNTKF